MMKPRESIDESIRIGGDGSSLMKDENMKFHIQNNLHNKKYMKMIQRMVAKNATTNSNLINDEKNAEYGSNFFKSRKILF